MIVVLGMRTARSLLLSSVLVAAVWFLSVVTFLVVAACWFGAGGVVRTVRRDQWERGQRGQGPRLRKMLLSATLTQDPSKIARLALHGTSTYGHANADLVPDAAVEHPKETRFLGYGV